MFMLYVSFTCRTLFEGVGSPTRSTDYQYYTCHSISAITNPKLKRNNVGGMVYTTPTLNMYVLAIHLNSRREVVVPSEEEAILFLVG